MKHAEIIELLKEFDGKGVTKDVFATDITSDEIIALWDSINNTVIVKDNNTLFNPFGF